MITPAELSETWECHASFTYALTYLLEQYKAFHSHKHALNRVCFGHCRTSQDFCKAVGAHRCLADCLSSLHGVLWPPFLLGLKDHIEISPLTIPTHKLRMIGVCRGPLNLQNFYVGASVLFSAFGGHAMAL